MLMVSCLEEIYTRQRAVMYLLEEEEEEEYFYLIMPICSVTFVGLNPILKFEDGHFTL